MLLLRMLEKESMGTYFIAVIVVALLVTLSDFGLELALVKKLPEADSKQKSLILRSALFLRAASSILVSTILILLVFLGDVPVVSEIDDLAGPVLVLFWFHSYRSLFLRVLQAERLFKAFAATQLLAAILKTIVIAGLYLIGNSNLTYVLIVEGGCFLISLVYAISQLNMKLIAAPVFRLDEARDLLKFGIPLYLNMLVNHGNERGASYIVAGLGGPVAIVHYSVAQRLADAARRLFDPFVSVYLPAQTTHFAAKQVKAAKDLASRSLVWITLLIAVGTLVFAVVREPVISLLFTAKYSLVADAAVIFLCALLLRCIQVLMGYFGIAAGFNYMPFKVSLLSSVFNLMLTFGLFKLYGYEGAIFALVMTQFMICVLYAIGLRAGGMGLELAPVITVTTLFTLSLAWVYFFDGKFLVALLGPILFVLSALGLISSLRSDLRIVFQKVQNVSLPLWEFKRQRRSE